MPTWLLIVLGIYAAGFLGMWVYAKSVFLAALWPATLLWMLIGNIQ